MSEEIKKKVHKVVPRWYKKMKFWNVVILIITPVTAGGEAAIYITQAHPSLHGLVIFTGIVLAVIKYTIKDLDGDGFVD